MFHLSQFPTFRRLIPVIIPAGVVLSLIVVLAVFFFVHSRQLMERQLRQQLLTSATLAARQFDGLDFSEIRTADDVNRPEYIEYARMLEQIQPSIPNALFVYLMRKTDDPMVLEFIIDGDALLSDAELDEDGDGIVDASELSATPGFPYDITTFPAMRNAFMHPAVDSEVTSDQWGSYISAYAPIYDHTGKATAIFGVDVDADTFLRLSTIILTPELLLLISIAGLLVAVYIGFYLWLWRLGLQHRLSDERFALINLAMHQIGAPLAAFRWWLDLLRESYTAPSSNRDCQLAYRRLDESIARMTEVINALKQACILQEGHLPYTSTPVAFRHIADDIKKDLHTELRRHKHTLTIDVPDNLTPRMDAKLIVGVLRELIMNSISYSPPETTIKLQARMHGKRVEVTVTDAGYGMTDEDIQYVFEPFRRGKHAAKHKPVGNGMGLFLAKRIIEMGGGFIRIHSVPNKGTTVTFTLPTH